MTRQSTLALLRAPGVDLAIGEHRGAGQPGHGGSQANQVVDGLNHLPEALQQDLPTFPGAP